MVRTAVARVVIVFTRSENPQFAIRNRRVVSRRLPVSSVIDDLEIIVSCSREDEWDAGKGEFLVTSRG